MQNKNLLALLQQIGLSERESCVYLALLSAGPSKITLLARTAGVKRTTIYPVLESLISKGLAREEESGFKKYVVAESPERLGALLDQWRDDFFKRLPEFQALQRFGEYGDVIKYYRGLPAIKSMYATMFDTLKRGDAYLVISDTEKWQRMDPAFAEKIASRRGDMELAVRILTTDSPEARHFKQFERNFSSEMRILPLNVSYNAALTITSQMVVIIEFTSFPSAIVIEHPAVVSLGTSLFEMIWRTVESNRSMINISRKEL